MPHDKAATRKRLQEKSKKRRQKEKAPKVKRTELAPRTQETQKREVKVAPVQKLEKKPFSKGKAIAIGAGIGAGIGVGLATKSPAAGRAAGKTTTALITRTATFGKQSITTQRAFVGRSMKSSIDKIFRRNPKVAGTASRFGTNTKSKALTMSFATKLGLSLGAAGLFVGAVSSYPFAGFIKEEALQTLGFAVNTAERNKDLEGMEIALQEVEEIINAAPSILDKIPYANVQKQLKSFFEASEKKLKIDRRRLEQLRGEEKAGESAFQRERRETDEAAFERKREFGEEESERFEGIQEENEARRQKGEIRQQEERELTNEFFKAIANKDRALQDDILRQLRELAERGL